MQSSFVSQWMKRLWTLAAICLVLVATLISILRLVLPYADGYKQEIETFVAEKYGAHLNIGRLSAGWEGLGPAIIIDDVVVSLPQQTDIGIGLKQTRLEIDFWGSIVAREFKAQNVVLSGLELEIELAGLMARPSSESQSPLGRVLADIFLHHLSQFTLEDSQLTLLTRGRISPVLDIERLQWTNLGDRHQGVGNMYLQGFVPNSLNFVLDLSGQEVEELEGQLYVDAQQLELGSWLSSLLPSAYKVRGGELNAQAWVDISQGAIKDALLDLSESRIVLSARQQEHDLQLQRGKLMWLPEYQGWGLRSDDWQILYQDNKLPLTSFSLSGDSKGIYAHVPNIDLQAAAELAAILPLQTEARDALESLQPKGSLSQIQVSVVEGEVGLTGRAHSLEWQTWQEVPGMAVKDLAFDLNREQLLLSLSTQNAQLKFNRLLPEPLFVNQLDMTLSASWGETGWWLSSDNLVFDTDKITLEGAFGLGDKGQGVEMDLAVRASNLVASQAKNLFPSPYMPEDVQSYLSQALVGGKLPDSRVLWKGRFSDYPYDTHTGIFQAFTRIHELEFNFDPEWPNLRDAELDVRFENLSMDIQAISGKLMEANLSQLSASIPNLVDGAVLSIDAKVDTQGHIVRDVMANSGLKDSVGSALEYLGVEGELASEFILEIGLASGDVRAYGSADILSGTLNLKEPALRVEQVKGRVYFDNDKINASDVTASLWGMPLSIQAKGQQTDVEYLTQVQIGESWSLEAVNALVEDTLLKKLSGDLAWEAQLEVHLPVQGSFYVESTASADLTNMVSQLPEPYQKQVGESGTLDLSVNVDSSGMTAQLSGDQDLHFFGHMPAGSEQFSRAQLTLGPEQRLMPASGFHIGVELGQIDLVSWIDLIAGFPSGEDSGPLPEPGLISGSIEQAKVFGFRLNDLNIKLQPEPRLWQVKLDSKEARGRATLGRDWLNQGVTFNADYLWLNKWIAEEGESEPLSPQKFFAHFPPLSFECLDCRYDNITLGQLEAEVRRESDALVFKNVLLDDQNMRLSADGRWVPQGDGLMSLKGRVDTQNTGQFLSDWHLTSSMRDSKGEGEFNVQWQGLPFMFNFPSLNGELDWRLAEGHLTEVSDQGARLFSILSLDSIVRKLKLDFRDVFSKGFFYNSLESKMELRNGIASTSKTEIDGIPGDLLLIGSTNLVTSELNYQLSFTPKVTSSLPVIVAWMVNPATGLAALAVDKALQSTKVVSEVKFALTGTIENPVVTELERSSRDIQLPGAEPKQVVELEEPVAEDDKETKKNEGTP